MTLYEKPLRELEHAAPVRLGAMNNSLLLLNYRRPLTVWSESMYGRRLIFTSSQPYYRDKIVPKYLVSIPYLVCTW